MRIFIWNSQEALLPGMDFPSMEECLWRTSPLWVFLLVAAHAFVPDWMVAGKLLTIAGAIFALQASMSFQGVWRHLHPGSGTKHFPRRWVLLLVTNPFFCYWSFSGMEAVTAAGLDAGARVAATSRRPA